MSECSDKSVKSDDDVNVFEKKSKRKKANPIQKFCYFLTESGYSLNFVLLPDNLSDSEVTEATDMIQTHMGTVSNNIRDVGCYFAVLVADGAATWNYFGDVFKLSYIKDCVDAGKVLNIALYLKEKSKLYVENFDYMSVIYHRKYSWETVPEIFRLPRPEPACQPSRKASSDSDSSLDSVHSYNSQYPVTLRPNSKQTKSAYSREEKEAMLRFVVQNKAYNRVKGKQLYKEMEAANVSSSDIPVICPIRTWQSLKDHFLRTLVKEISNFACLTKEQKLRLKEALLPYK